MSQSGAGQTRDPDQLQRMLETERKRRKDLEDKLERALDRIADLENRVDDHGNRLNTVEHDYQNLAGVTEREQSTAKKRRLDLALSLKRKAEANGGAYAMDYRGVKDDLAGHGHGDVSDKQAFRDMEKIAERVGGVAYPVSHPVTGNKAVEFDLTEFHGFPSEMDSVSDGVSSQGNGAARSDQNDPDDDQVKPTYQG